MLAGHCGAAGTPLLVGLLVGLFRQPASGFWRFVAVDTRTTKSAASPVTTGVSCKQRNAGGGTRTPDTRIMIPLAPPPIPYGYRRFGRSGGALDTALVTPVTPIARSGAQSAPTGPNGPTDRAGEEQCDWPHL
jgi:hypothetical protein